MRAMFATTALLIVSLFMATLSASSDASADDQETNNDATASAKVMTHIVTSRGVKFAPMFLYIEPGDVVAFENMNAHNVETLDTMVPEGQEKIFSEVGENVFFTFDQVGIVVYKCTPHWGSRMGGIIVVGNPENPAEIIDAYMASLETQEIDLPARGLLKKLKKDMEEKGLI